MVDELPFDAQIGVIGHEYGHIIDYMSKNFFMVCYTGIGYMFKSYRSKLENKVDNITISHGLGWQIYHFTAYIQLKSDASDEYKKYKKENYYSKNDLKRQIFRHPNIYLSKIYKRDFFK